MMAIAREESNPWKGQASDSEKIDRDAGADGSWRRNHQGRTAIRMQFQRHPLARWQLA